LIKTKNNIINYIEYAYKYIKNNKIIIPKLKV